MGEQNDSTGSDRNVDRGRTRRRWIIGSLIGATALLSGAAAVVYGSEAGWHVGCGGAMHHGIGANRIERFVGHGLADVDATAEQKAQVTAILQSTHADVHALADRHASLHRELHTILSAPVIDRARLEGVRADGMRLADEASQRIVSGIADAAEVLTAEQRAALVAEAQRHHRWRHGKTEDTMSAQ